MDDAHRDEAARKRVQAAMRHRHLGAGQSEYDHLFATHPDVVDDELGPYGLGCLDS